MSSVPDSTLPADPLDAVIADYLQRAEAGAPPDREPVLAAHPDLADRLLRFFADLDRFGPQAAAFRMGDPGLPEDLGDYEIIEELGRGGMGVVYKARQKSLGRVVALKMIRDLRSADASALRRFREEAGTAATLDHANIVPIYEVGEHGDQPYFSMKLIEGPSLARSPGRYADDPRAAATLLVKVCRAVQHAHQRGVLHRDLKPGNVLVDSDGEPHVTDFGLARRADGVRGHTSSDAVLGTPEYMSPEQAAGLKDLTTAVDIYGLGAILYALLAGRPPFPGGNVYETLRAVVERDPDPPRHLRPNVPKDLEVICLKCLAKEPDRRYPSAEALAEDLERWRRGEPIHARSAGRFERARMWARRRPAVAALVAVSIVSLATLLGGGIYSANRIARQNRDLHNQAGELTAALDTVRQIAHSLTTKQAELEANAKQLSRTVATLRRNEYTLELEQYRGKLVEAQRELAAGNRQKTLQILDECQWDLRNWEFDYLAECCKDAPAIVPMGDEPDAAPKPDPKTREWPKVTRSLAFTPDGKQLVTTLRGRLTVFDTATGKAVRRIDEDHAWDAFALSPDGKLLACYDASAAGVVVMRFETGEAINSFGTGTVRGSRIGSPMDTFAKKGLAFSPDSKRLLVGSTVFDVETGAGVVLKYPLGGGTIRADGWHDIVPFSPGGQLVAMAFNPVNVGEENQAAVWDAHTGEVRAWLKGDPRGLGFLAFSPAGDRVAAGGDRNGVEVFDPKSGERLFACEAATGIHCVAFTRDGRRLISGGESGTIRVFDAYLGKEILTLPPIPEGGAIHSLAVSPDGSKLAAVVGTPLGGRRAFLWRGSDTPRPGVLSWPGLPIHSMTFGAGGDRVVAFSRDSGRGSELAVFDSRSGKLQFQLSGTHGGLIHPTKRQVILANRKTIDIDSGATVAEWPTDSGVYRHGDYPFAFRPDRAAVSLSGKYLVHLADDVVSVCELSAGRRVAAYKFPKHYRRFDAPFAYHPDGERLFVAVNDPQQDDHSVRVWNVALPKDPGGEPQTKAELRAAPPVESPFGLDGHTARVRCVAVSPNGGIIASGGDDRKVRIWDAESRKLLQILGGRPWSVQHLGFSADSRYLLVVADAQVTIGELWRVGQVGTAYHAELRKPRRAGGVHIHWRRPNLRIIAGNPARCYEWDIGTATPTRSHRDVSFLK